MIFLLLAAFIAGFIDSIVGGGGLVQLPAMLIGLPHLPLPLILGTNKVAAICGTLCSVWRYQRSLRLSFRPYFPAIGTALVGSFLGATLTNFISPDFMKPLVVWLLVVVWVFFLFRPNFGNAQEVAISSSRVLFRAALLGLSIGCYDGFFGPGTGTWFVVGGIFLLGLNFLHASALSKVLNVATNAAAIVSFGINQNIDWNLGALLGGANILGAWIGSHLAIQRGSKFVRVFFLVIVGCMIIKLAFGR